MTRGRRLLCAAPLIVLQSLATSSGAPANRTITLRIGISTGPGRYGVRTMDLEEYVARVVAGEAARESRAEALEALAITVRTFALANRGRHRADGFDLCDQTHCQVVRAATAATERAAAATAARVLLRDRAPASVYYTASCGGRTEVPSSVWPGAEDPPFLPSRPDDNCAGAPVWTAEIDERDLLRALKAAGFQGDRLRSLAVLSRNSSGRVARLKLDGLKPDEISGQDLRVAVGRSLGWQHIKSTAFELRRNGHAYRFNGHGSGHGVGLCVIGSARLADRGATAAQILTRYFPGLEVGRVPDLSQAEVRPRGSTEMKRPDRAGRAVRSMPDAVVIALPDGDEGEREALLEIAREAREDLARKLGVSVPAPLTIRFHPTTDDYEQATGYPWFTSGAWVNGELHLLPPAVLRERGVLDRTIRHELVHVMTDAVFAGRPMWVREGAAIYFSGDRPIPAGIVQRPAFQPAPRASCPTDAELLRPVSVGALSNAYARASACFAKQIAAGRKWQDVR
jgi:SpoIID/LytB domain protein